MAGAGIAGLGQYAVGSDLPVDCRVYLSQASQEFGDDVTPVAGNRTQLGIFLADVPNPVRDATVVLDGDTWRLKRQIGIDQSISTWVVTHG